MSDDPGRDDDSGAQGALTPRGTTAAARGRRALRLVLGGLAGLLSAAAALGVAELCGYVSACTWLRDLELTRFDAYDAYRVRRGWSREAPIKTASRIDTPRPDGPRGPGGAGAHRGCRGAVGAPTGAPLVVLPV